MNKPTEFENSSGSGSEESVYSGLEEEPDTSSDGDEGENGEFGSLQDDSSEDYSDDDDTDQEEEEEEEDAEHGKLSSNKEDKTQPPSSADANSEPFDEYREDSSDEEDIRNTVGNVPMEWYRDFDHLGYDITGGKILKPKQGDELDEFLNKMDNPDYWRTVTDKMTGQKTVLSDADLEMIKRIQRGAHPSSSENMYEPWVDFFSSETMIHPVTNRPADKRSFVPSKWEKLKVGQMVHAIKMGWMKRRTEQKTEEEEQDPFYMLWKDDEEPDITKRYRQHIPAPKLPLPGHAESYNPPPEYLFTKEEEEKWKEQEPEDRRINFNPQKFSALRKVPAYDRFVNERFERCLDLYLCPRQRKMRMNVNPEDLIPKLPKPKDLQPFPTTEAVVYKGHTDMVRCVCPDPSGQWLATGSDDNTVRFWEVSTGRCMKMVPVSGKVNSLVWNPNPAVSLLAVVVNTTVLILNPGLGDKLLVSNTDTLVSSFEDTQDTPAEKKVPVDWIVSDLNLGDYKTGLRLKVEHPKEVSQVTWHVKGDYFATVMPKGESMSVLIHQLSRRRSQNPFSKSKGLVQRVLFHPVRPFLFVATQRFVRVYNLLKQQLTKKLQTNCKWVSSMDVHPGGDNVIIGSYDCRLSWFDLDLSTKPYQTLKHHKKALRQVTFHPRYPLFASASDDCSIIVCHGMVYSDLLQNPLIVPVKVLRGHTATNSIGVLDCHFHPTQPWIFSAGADGTARLYT